MLISFGLLKASKKKINTVSCSYYHGNTLVRRLKNDGQLRSSKEMNISTYIITIWSISRGSTKRMPKLCDE